MVALKEGVPVGTASLALEDADSRPNLSPWLASVFVAAEARGRGYARVLVTAVESAAMAADSPVLWLFTDNAVGLYAGLGWREAGTVEDRGTTYALMQRDLAAAG